MGRIEGLRRGKPFYKRYHIETKDVPPKVELPPQVHR